MDGQEEGHVKIGVEVQELDEQHDVVVAGNMIFISQGHLYGEDDETVCETQYNHEQIHSNMESFYQLKNMKLMLLILLMTLLNMQLTYKLTLPSQVTPPPLLEAPMISLN